MKSLATCRDYADLHHALRQRASDMGISRAEIDARIKDQGWQWPDTYASKLLAPRPIRAIGRRSLGPLLNVLGLAIVLVETQGDLRVNEVSSVVGRKPLVRDPANMPDDRAIARKALCDLLRQNGRKGGRISSLSRMSKLTAKERSRIAKRSARTLRRKRMQAKATRPFNGKPGDRA